MNKNLLSIFFCCIMGVFFSSVLTKEQVKLSSQIIDTLYFIEYGVYDDIKQADIAIQNIDYFIKIKEDELIHVYVGITTKKNLEKLKGYFKDLGYDINVREKIIPNNSFLEVLNQYELMLEQTNDKKSIKAIESGVISKYEEMIYE